LKIPAAQIKGEICYKLLCSTGDGEFLDCVTFNSSKTFISVELQIEVVL